MCDALVSSAPPLGPFPSQPPQGSSLLVVLRLPSRRPSTCAQLHAALLAGLGLLGVPDQDLPVGWGCDDEALGGGSILARTVTVHFPGAAAAGDVLGALRALPADVLDSAARAWLVRRSVGSL